MVRLKRCVCDQGVDLLILIPSYRSSIPQSTISLLPSRIARHLLGAIEDA